MNFNISQDISEAPDTSFSLLLNKSFHLVLLNLLLLCMSVYWFNIEHDLGLPALMPILFVGFLLHALLPLTYRPPFFLTLTLGAIVYLLGWTSGLITILIALSLIGICHLPASLLARQLLLLIVAVLLALFRADILPFFQDSSILVLVAGLFMFRTFLYLYEIKHYDQPVNVFHRLNYFFLFPNIIFPIFPIVDFKLFYRQYYNQLPVDLYQQGIKRMLRGLLHLLVYRVLYFYFVPALPEITDIFSLLAYIVFSYMLILRLSGLFHLVLGITFLFGYNLPEIFNNYFLANGFDDYWRRINTYWRDFILKIFYYPIYFRLKKHGVTTALICSTLIIFIVNWLMHAYQWFWILGTYDFRLTDTLFWGIFGVLVTINIFFQVNHKKKKVKLVKNNLYYAKEAGKVMATFLTIALLWSLWISTTVGEWWSILRVATTAEWMDWIKVMGLGGVVFLVLMLVLRYENDYSAKVDEWMNQWGAIYNLGVLMLLGSLSFFAPTIDSSLLSGTPYSITELQDNQLNAADEERAFTGYYDEVLTPSQFATNTWSKAMHKTSEEIPQPEKKILNSPSFQQLTGDILLQWHLPGHKYFKKGGQVEINEWGFRGREGYLKEAPAEVTRIAVLGGSNEFGPGLDNEEVWTSILEKKLNEQSPIAGQKFEVLNFSRSGISLVQTLQVFKEKALAFHPHYVLLPIPPREYNRLGEFLFMLYNENQEHLMENTILPDLVAVAAIQPDDYKHTIKQKIQAHIGVYLDKLMAAFKHNAITQDAQLTVVDIPMVMPGKKKVKEMRMNFLKVTEKHQVPLMDLQGIYDTIDDRQGLCLSAEDGHPNSRAHTLIAEQLYLKLLPLLQETSKK